MAQRGKGLAQESSDLSGSSRTGTKVGQTPKPVLLISMRLQSSTGYSLGWSLMFDTRPLAPHTSQGLLGQQQGLPISFQLLPTGFELRQLPLHLEQAALQGFLLQAAACTNPQAQPPRTQPLRPQETMDIRAWPTLGPVPAYLPGQAHAPWGSLSHS